MIMLILLDLALILGDFPAGVLGFWHTSPVRDKMLCA